MILNLQIQVRVIILSIGTPETLDESTRLKPTFDIVVCACVCKVSLESERKHGAMSSASLKVYWWLLGSKCELAPQSSYMYLLPR